MLVGDATLEEEAIDDDADGAERHGSSRDGGRDG